MNGNSTAGVEPANTRDEVDHLSRLRRIGAAIIFAKEQLLHRQTHETNEARKWLDLAQEEVEEGIDAEAPGEGIQGSEGVHVEDPEDAEEVKAAIGSL